MKSGTTRLAALLVSMHALGCSGSADTANNAPDAPSNNGAASSSNSDSSAAGGQASPDGAKGGSSNGAAAPASVDLGLLWFDQGDYGYEPNIIGALSNGTFADEIEPPDPVDMMTSISVYDAAHQALYAVTVPSGQSFEYGALLGDQSLIVTTRGFGYDGQPYAVVQHYGSDGKLLAEAPTNSYPSDPTILADGSMVALGNTNGSAVVSYYDAAANVTATVPAPAGVRSVESISVSADGAATFAGSCVAPMTDVTCFYLAKKTMTGAQVIAHTSAFGRAAIAATADGFVVGGRIADGGSVTDAWGTAIDPASPGGVVALLDTSGHARWVHSTPLPVTAIASAPNGTAYVGYGDEQSPTPATAGALEVLATADGRSLFRMNNAMTIDKLVVTLPNRVLAYGHPLEAMSIGGKSFRASEYAVLDFIAH